MLFPLILPFTLPANTIQTTFVEQAPERNWNQPWQDACEEAGLLTAIYYKQNKKPNTKKIIADLKDIFAYETDQNWGHDIPLSKLSQIAQKKFGYKTKIIENPTLDDLKSQIDQKRPVIVPANGKTLYRENKNFSAGGPYYHNIVILGYDKVKKKFIVHDVGTKRGAYFKYSFDLLLSAIHDLPATDKKEDIQTGAKRVMVLL